MAKSMAKNIYAWIRELYLRIKLIKIFANMQFIRNIFKKNFLK